MPRLTQLDDIMFPVQEHPLFVNLKTKYGERSISVPDKKALVNARTNRVLGVVSRGYRLVTNAEALDWAYQCCITAFPETKPGEWQVDASDAPQTGGHCYIDLTHNTKALDFTLVQAANRPDVFGPFIRVTNSYNGLRALTFDIGYHRKVCKNGLILPQSIISFKFNHIQRDIKKEIAFEIDKQKLAALKTGFNDYFSGLQKCTVPRDCFKPLLCGVLHIRKPKDLDKRPESLIEDWTVLNLQLQDLCEQYFRELGGNAYAAFNAITDFASNHPDNQCIHRERNSMQRLAGYWLSTFHQECRKDDFQISAYLAKLAKENENLN